MSGKQKVKPTRGKTESEREEERVTGKTKCLGREEFWRLSVVESENRRDGERGEKKIEIRETVSFSKSIFFCFLFFFFETIFHHYYGLTSSTDSSPIILFFLNCLVLVPCRYMYIYIFYNDYSNIVWKYLWHKTFK